MLNNLKVLWPFLFAIILLLFPLVLFQKGDVLLYINANRESVFDVFFKNITILGDATFCLILLALTLRGQLKWVLILLVGFAIHVLFVHIFKQWLAANELRPYLFFYRSGLIENLDLIEGVKIRKLDSFPSGHTATVFFMASFLAIFIRKTWVSLVLCTLAVLVGLSRIYLLQHWFVDTYFGMLFGVASSILGYILVINYPKEWHYKRIEFNPLRIE